MRPCTNGGSISLTLPLFLKPALPFRTAAECGKSWKKFHRKEKRKCFEVAVLQNEFGVSCLPVNVAQAFALTTFLKRRSAGPVC